ncbi:hypothetical protein [Variovorax terrae]|uniref:Uncharacterized protein n=1 Tax=Variovorax terrae TaxID=2923278 RepID=A0A9X1VWQ8_9BURK|nr:hypothetical protein [Variovorax terrae]MCJ0764623.1 hypothetical protein [Variovorax terrae]
MPIDPIQVLQAAQRPVSAGPLPPSLLVAGATGALGNEVLRRLVGAQRFAPVQVLAGEPIQAGLRGVQLLQVAAGGAAHWPPAPAEAGLIMFEPPRLYHDRERALWTPMPGQLVEVAAWMRRSGVRTLAVVLPHAQGRLPEALKRGLASLDEQAVAALGFERLLIVRSAGEPAARTASGLLPRVAAWMLSVFSYMVPSSEQPVRAAKVAELVDAALQLAPPGIHIAAPELVWRAAQGDVRGVAAQWLRP